jgi:hypothetical protein
MFTLSVQQSSQRSGSSIRNIGDSGFNRAIGVSHQDLAFLPQQHLETTENIVATLRPIHVA